MIDTFTALITPLKKDKSIDHNGLINLLKFQNDSMISGIVLLGTTSEIYSLNDNEASMILNLGFTYFKKKIIIGLKGNSLIEIKNQLTKYEKYDAYAYLIPLPYFNKGNEKGILDYFDEISKLTNKNIIVYYVPSRIAYEISYSLIEKLSKIKNIIGIKNCSTNLYFNQKISKLNSDKFKIFAGSDELILQNLFLNNNGGILVISNLIPNYIMNIINTFSTKQQYAKNSFLQIIDLISSLSVDVNPIPIKYLLSKVSTINDVVRLPLSTLSEINKIKINNQFEKCERIINEYSFNR